MVLGRAFNDVAVSINSIKIVKLMSELNRAEKNGFACDMIEDGQLCKCGGSYRFLDQDGDEHIACEDHAQVLSQDWFDEDAQRC